MGFFTYNNRGKMYSFDSESSLTMEQDPTVFNITTDPGFGSSRTT